MGQMLPKISTFRADARESVATAKVWLGRQMKTAPGDLPIGSCGNLSARRAPGVL